jgi:hypothetical protein
VSTVVASDEKYGADCHDLASALAILAAAFRSS